MKAISKLLFFFLGSVALNTFDISAQKCNELFSTQTLPTNTIPTALGKTTASALLLEWNLTRRRKCKTVHRKQCDRSFLEFYSNSSSK